MLKLTFKRSLVAAFAWAAAGTVAAAQPPADLGRRLVEGYIAPATARLEASARGLGQTLQTWCAKPDAAGAQQVRGQFAELVQAWSGVEFLRFGPLVQDNRFERIFFWPDPRGIVLRQVQGLLAGQAAADARELAGRSVAVQGLPALEYVLYGDDGLLARPGGEGFASACAYAVAVTRNVARVGGELARAWAPGGDYARHFERPAADDPLYRTTQEVAAEAVKALSTGLQFGRDVKLLPVMGKGPDSSQPKRAPFWRSGLTLPAMQAWADGLLGFYRAGGYDFGEDAWIAANVAGELARLRDVFGALSGPVESVLSDGDGYRRLQLAVLLQKNAKDLVDQHMAPALGVTIGFNALDGD
jgi:Predicted periplasmic lipoprotein